MVNKTLGYVVAGVGLVIIGLSYLRDNLLKFLPAIIDKGDMIITGIVVIAIGAVLSYSKSSKRVGQVSEEVPIYHGNTIVGYRKEKR